MSDFIRFFFTNDGLIHSVETQNVEFGTQVANASSWDEFVSEFDYYYCHSEQSNCFQTGESRNIILEKFDLETNTALVGTIQKRGTNHFFEAEILQVNEQYYSFNEIIEIIVNKIRNPIVGLIAASDFYINYGEEFQLDKKEYFKLTRNYADKMAEFVDQFILLMRLDENQENVFDEPVLFKPILNDVLKKYNKQIQDFSLHVVDYTTDSLFCQGSEELIQMAVKQIFLNSIQFGDTHRTIRLENVIEPNFCGISITDHGFGIKPEHALHIFKRFYRANKDTVRNHIYGFGLGLCLVKAIVKKLNGRIRVCSNASIGTHFSLLFPSKLVVEKPYSTELFL